MLRIQNRKGTGGNDDAVNQKIENNLLNLVAVTVDGNMKHLLIFSGI